jgi:hypothetical protein
MPPDAPSLARRFAEARADLAAGRLTGEALDALERLALAPALRQRLLYLHAATPSLYAGIVAAALHEPVPGALTQVDPLGTMPDYASVHAALCDGWRVVHFPDQRAPFDDREIDIVGYEFILEKWEAIDGD